MFRRVWDFNTKHFEYTHPGHWNSGSQKLISREGSSETREYIPYPWGVTENTDATYFVSNNDIPNGLKFTAEQGKFGLNNPADGDDSNKYNRYLAFGRGSSIVIPSDILQQCNNPRIRIKMARAGDKRHLTISNGTDALDTPISYDYIIGGSMWRGDYDNGKDKNYRGEYHFGVQSTSVDFKITTTSDDWLLLLYVEVYDSPEVISENTMTTPIWAKTELLVHINYIIMDWESAHRLIMIISPQQEP